MTVKHTGITEQSLLPKYLIEGEYYTNTLSLNETDYLYLPVDYNTLGDTLILVNKTGPFGENGDVSIMMTV